MMLRICLPVIILALNSYFMTHLSTVFIYVWCFCLHNIWYKCFASIIFDLYKYTYYYFMISLPSIVFYDLSTIFHASHHFMISLSYLYNLFIIILHLLLFCIYNILSMMHLQYFMLRIYFMIYIISLYISLHNISVYLSISLPNLCIWSTQYV